MFTFLVNVWHLQYAVIQRRLVVTIANFCIKRLYFKKQDLTVVLMEYMVEDSSN